MIPLASLALFAQLGAASPASRVALTSEDSLRARIEQRIAEVPGAAVGVAFRDLARPDTLYLDADERFHAASTMKVPIMIELFRRIDRHQLALDDRIELKNHFTSIVDGSPYTLDAGDDSDSLVYTWVGSRVSVRDLLEHMITRSSN